MKKSPNLSTTRGSQALGAAAIVLGMSGAGTASATECETLEPDDIMSQSFTDHWEAYDNLACLEESLIARGDRRAIFTSGYTLTTLRMAEAIDAGFFQDTVWMTSYQIQFANYYREAFYNYEIGNTGAVPNVWMTAFDAAATGETLMVQDILLGMTAHITRDLPYALEYVYINPRWAKHQDHTLVNDVLGDVADEMMFAMSEIYGANFVQIDGALGPLDELILAVGFAAAREGAWLNAKSLDNSRWWNRWLTVSWIENTASATADLTLLAIGPALHDAVAHLEGTNPGSTFCQHFSCSN